VNVRGAVVVVSGASSGIGRATAWAFARGGATLVLAARREDLLRELANEIERRGGEALVVPTDVTERPALEALRDAVLVAHGRCDVLVNNAGIPGGGRFADVSLDRIEATVQTNLVGLLTATKLFLPAMLAAGRGHVVNVASIAGRVALPGAAVYSATKHAVVAFSEALDAEVEPDGVRVTAVNPGLVRTESFPASDVPDRWTTSTQRVADTIVRVVRKGIAPEISVPRAAGSLLALHAVAPPLFRAGVRAATRTRNRRGARQPASDPAD
jgi:short-subunit dehydrogenase